MRRGGGGWGRGSRSNSKVPRRRRRRRRQPYHYCCRSPTGTPEPLMGRQAQTGQGAFPRTRIHA
eukprot:4397811-Pyramimonas_sp.AAC.1